MKIVNSIDLVGDVLQSSMTYVYIGSRTQIFESDMTKSFLNKQNFKPYLDSTLSTKPDHPEWEIGLSGFCDFGFLLDFIPS
jgi:hypothetical protein